MDIQSVLTINEIAERIASGIKEHLDELSQTLVVTKGIDPVKQHEGDAAFDLEACLSEPEWIPGGASRLIPTGVFAAIPLGHVGLICSRSGLAIRRSLFVLNAPGVIDPSYRGEIKVILHNLTRDQQVIRPGDRVAQLLIMPTSNVRLLNNDALFDVMTTERGDGGFGSTGGA